MLRAALLSIHARVEGAGPSDWDDPSLVQVWGPRYQVYVVAARDLAVFTLGRLPDTGKTREKAEDLAARLHVFLGGTRVRYDDARQALVVHGNTLRYAASTGRLAIRWEGARRPTVWTVPTPEIEPAEATLELARRYLHIFGPARPEAFGKWAGIGAQKAVRALDDLRTELIPVLTPSGEARMFARDEPTIQCRRRCVRRCGLQRPRVHDRACRRADPRRGRPRRPGRPVLEILDVGRFAENRLVPEPQLV
jgi:hypothetical protein